jgi:uncharacterized protein YfaS (alpha-2-macroglobulin family)
LARDRWLGTQTTAYCLIAVSKYATRSGQGLEFDFAVANGPEGTVATDHPLWQKAVPAAYGSQGKVSLSNHMQVPLYARVILTGKPPVGKELPACSNVGLKVEYLDMEGNPLDVTTLEQGTDFLAAVTVEYQGRGASYDQMALTQIFPPGWEIVNTRMDDISYQAHQYDVPEYQDIRDDRVYTHFDLGYRGKKAFVIALSATYAGRYYLPPVPLQLMHDDDIYANSRGQWVNVVMPGMQRSAK